MVAQNPLSRHAQGLGQFGEAIDDDVVGRIGRRVRRAFRAPFVGGAHEGGLEAEAPAARGYKTLHAGHVLQTDEGCDLDFLTQRPYTAKAPV